MRSTERVLYPPLERRLRRAGYVVEGAAVGRVFTLPFTLQAADLIGFKWRREGDVDVWAVEAKRGNSRASIRTALAQALAYRVVVPRVSVAAETYVKGFGEIVTTLRALGLGYMRATAHEANEWEPPAASGAHDHRLYVRTLRHAALLRLLA